LKRVDVDVASGCDSGALENRQKGSDDARKQCVTHRIGEAEVRLDRQHPGRRQPGSLEDLPQARAELYLRS
jgi:hypothetical protein